jgi:hypothetical protein
MAKYYFIDTFKDGSVIYSGTFDLKSAASKRICGFEFVKDEV